MRPACYSFLRWRTVGQKIQTTVVAAPRQCCIKRPFTYGRTNVIDKQVNSAADAVADIPDGATIMVSGFQGSGMPNALLRALVDHGSKDLTLICNGAGPHGTQQARLTDAGQVSKLVCSSARGRSDEPTPLERLWRAGEIALELVPQGTFAERIRAGGAGLAAFYTPVSVGTDLAEGKEAREFEGRTYVLETALKADFTLLRADRADRLGNLGYRGTQINFGPAMAAAGATTIAEVGEIVEVGSFAPECVQTPGIFVNRVVVLPDLR